jgi:hypothetical protein
MSNDAERLNGLTWSRSHLVSCSGFILGRGACQVFEGIGLVVVLLLVAVLLVVSPGRGLVLAVVAG